MKNGPGNLAPCDTGQLAATVWNRLKRIQYRPALIDGFIAQTGLTPRTRTALDARPLAFQALEHFPS